MLLPSPPHATTTGVGGGALGLEGGGGGGGGGVLDPRERVRELRLAKDTRKQLIEVQQRRVALDNEYLGERGLEEERHAAFLVEANRQSAEIERDLASLRAKREEDGGGSEGGGGCGCGRWR